MREMFVKLHKLTEIRETEIRETVKLIKIIHTIKYAPRFFKLKKHASIVYKIKKSNLR